MIMLVRQIFDEKLAQYAYLVGCPATGEAIVIDPERDVDRYVEAARKKGLRLVAAVDTHIHADYLSGLRELAERGVKVYASDEGGPDWRYEWLIGSRYPYQLLKDGDRFQVGNLVFEAVHTPGHTPEHMSYLVVDRGSGADVPIALATGDFVFVGDLGRPDLLETAAGQAGTMEAGARTLFRTLQRFRDLPEFVQVWPAHGAGSACGKSLGDIPLSTVGYELRNNASIQAATSEAAFVRYILSGQPEPPLYFARMKRDNRQGPPVLGALPAPPALTAAELAALAGRTDVAVLDTRDRKAFLAGHLPGAILAELDYQFTTIAGSYVGEDVPLYLVVEPAHVDEAVRMLVRIGLDRIAGYATAETLAAVPAHGVDLAALETIDMAELERRRLHGEGLVLDVRGQAEYETRHVPGALNIAHTRLYARLPEVPKDRPVLVHCNSGGRSAAAASLLARHGYQVVDVDDRVANYRETEVAVTGV
jgi:hydroxyacylglutathione hydrolase